MSNKEKESKVYKVWFYHKTYPAIIINSDKLKGYLEKGWKESPADFKKEGL